MSIKFKSSIESEGKIIQSKHRSIKHTDTVQTLEVKVVTKTAAHPEHGNGSSYGYTIDGVEGAYLELTPGITYRFDQSDGSNGGTGTGGGAHPLAFYEDAAKTTAYNTQVTTNGSPGSSGAYTQITPTTATPPILFYQCTSHPLMGSYAKFGTGTVGDTYSINASVNASDSDDVDLNLNANSGTDSAVRLTAGSNISLTRNGAQQVTIAASGSALTVKDEGTASPTAATTLDFVGSGVAVTGDNSATKTITISGGGGGGSSSGQVTVQKNVATTSNATTTQFTISSAPASINNLQVYVDGVYQAKNNFSVSGTTVTLNAAPASGSVVEIIHFTVIDANIFLQSHTATSGQTSFNAGGLIAAKNDTQVYIDGVYQNKGNYSISGSNVVLNPAPATGAVVEIVNIKASAGSSGSVTWETTIEPQTGTSFTAAAGKGYFVNTTSGEITVNLPAGSAGDEIHFTDYASNFDTNAIIFSANGSQKILNSTDDHKCIIENATVRLIYQDDIKGWTADNITINPPSFSVDYLVVAGGGVAGLSGGGAGGLRTSFGSNSGGGASAETSLNLFESINYSVTVGAGGTYTGAYSGMSGNTGNGSDSVFSNITSVGGGRGSTNSVTEPPSIGGSGGGNTGSSSGYNTVYTGAAGTANQGYAGGSGYRGSSYPYTSWSGGGGGAGGVGAGANSSSGPNGTGGVGLAVNILNTTNAGVASVGEVDSSDVYFAGGGGAGCHTDGGNIQGSTGGLGGAGNGANSGNSNGAKSGNPGTQNTGGGGGGSASKTYGASTNIGGSGGSGVVILKYSAGKTLSASAGLTQSTGSPFTEGSYKISVFTAGTGTVSFS